MILSDADIKENLEVGTLKVHGLDKNTIRENGLDLTISKIYMKENPDYHETIDIHNQKLERFQTIDVGLGRFIIIKSLEFVLLSTREILELPDDIVGSCNIRSTIARTGLTCPPTTIDAGFHGALTIEIFNASKNDVVIHVGDRFLHVILSYTKTPCSAPYSGKYQNQKIVTPPKRTIL